MYKVINKSNTFITIVVNDKPVGIGVKKEAGPYNGEPSEVTKLLEWNKDVAIVKVTPPKPKVKTEIKISKDKKGS